MNAEREYALARLTRPSKVIELEAKKIKGRIYGQIADIHWRWRLQAAKVLGYILTRKGLAWWALHFR
jgi:hypothetical protein